MGFKILFSSALIGLLCLKGIECTCSSTYNNIQEEKVATMCKNTVVQGIMVYIDTDLGGDTTLDRGTACTCHVKTQRGKKLSVSSYFSGSINSKCGTAIDFSSPALGKNTIIGTPCYSYRFDVATHTYNNMSVGLRREEFPYKSTYCISLELGFCNNDQHQCGDGSCISSSRACDSVPDCADESDEKSCASNICPEGQVPCDDNTMCINPANKCDGTPQCTDQSDELPIHCSPGTPGSDTGSTSDDLLPALITVTCEESPFLPEPTTTTSTTTAETTSTTSTSTSTTPTTTSTTTEMATSTTTQMATSTTSSTTKMPISTTSSTRSIHSSTISSTKPITSTTTLSTTTTSTTSTSSTTPTTTSTTPSSTTTTTTFSSPESSPTTTTSTTTSTSPTSTSPPSTKASSSIAPSTTITTTTTMNSPTTTVPTSTTKITTTEDVPSTTKSFSSTSVTSSSTSTSTSIPKTSISSATTPTTTKMPHTTTTTATTTTQTSTTTPQPTTKQTITSRPRCNVSSQFQCGNGSCIPSKWRCDSLEDCNDQSDEIGCSSFVCGENMFLCDERRTCIKASERCDEKYQCPDLSDESPKYCGPKKPTSAPLKEDDDFDIAIIIGIICGVLFLLMTLTCFIYWVRTKNWNRRADGYAMKQESMKSVSHESAYSSPTPLVVHSVPTSKEPPTHVWYPSDIGKSHLSDLYVVEQIDGHSGDKHYILPQ